MEPESFDPHEKALALHYACTALMKTLIDAEVLDRDHLFSNLAGAQKQLTRIGETGAAGAFGELAQSWTAL